MPSVLNRLGLDPTIVFPDIRVTGSDDNFSEGNRASDQFVQKYFSQLTKLEVLQLYEMYRLDHEIFNYFPQVFIDAAK